MLCATLCTPGRPTPQDVLDRLRRLLAENRSKSEAARLAGCCRMTVYRLIQRGTIPPPKLPPLDI